MIIRPTPPRPCSPCFKLKPVSKTTKSGMTMVNVEPYGGLLHHTWWVWGRLGGVRCGRRRDATMRGSAGWHPSLSPKRCLLPVPAASTLADASVCCRCRFDRDLTVAGRVLVQVAGGGGEGAERLEHKLVS